MKQKCLLLIALHSTLLITVLGQQKEVASARDVLRREVELISSLMENANSNLNARVMKRFKQDENVSSVRLHQITFVFYSSHKSEVLPSFAEMSGPGLFTIKNGMIHASDIDTNSIPITYVRVQDPQSKVPVAELDVLLSVETLSIPVRIRYRRESFRFVREADWVLAPDSN